jgi:hypothetical protein
MFPPSKVDVLVERTVEFDFCGVRERRGIFVGVILRISLETGKGVGES